MALTTFIVWNDRHGPFDCHGSRKLINEIMKDVQFDEIYDNGDSLDFANVNRHSVKHPDIITTLQDEIDWGIEFYKEVREINPNAKIYATRGNHEEFLEKFILNNVPSFYNFFNLDSMLNFEKLEIESFPYQTPKQVGVTNLRIVHSPPSYGQTGSRTSLLARPGASYIYGCTHRMQCSSITDAFGEVHRAWFNGWLGSTTQSQEHKRVFSYMRGNENWQKCFGVGWHDGKHFDFQQSLIIQDGNKFKTSVFGQLYEVEV